VFHDLLRESDQLAADAGKPVIGSAEIQAAIDAQIRRGDRIYRRLQEEIGRHTIRIEVDGAQVGQVNGLSVISLGALAFGTPTRITARVRLGRGEVVDIEREVALGGPLHSKGVLILSGFLGGRFGDKRPLSLHASLVFEQNYGGVEGDSASAAELFALLSALAEAPIKQSFAITGSVDQRGQIQAIGGVNEKIEGFFDSCQAIGFTGRQGVIIPASNVKDLMLRRDVVAAAEAGRFAIYPIETVDQGLQLRWEFFKLEDAANQQRQRDHAHARCISALIGAWQPGGRRHGHTKLLPQPIAAEIQLVERRTKRVLRNHEP